MSNPSESSQPFDVEGYFDSMAKNPPPSGSDEECDLDEDAGDYLGRAKNPTHLPASGITLGTAYDVVMPQKDLPPQILDGTDDNAAQYGHPSYANLSSESRYLSDNDRITGV